MCGRVGGGGGGVVITSVRDYVQYLLGDMMKITYELEYML